jgi:hypothetical protein
VPKTTRGGRWPAVVLRCFPSVLAYTRPLLEVKKRLKKIGVADDEIFAPARRDADSR